MTRIRTGMPPGRKTDRSIKDHCRQAATDMPSVELRLFLRLKTPLLILSQIHPPTGDGLSSRLPRSARKGNSVVKLTTSRPGPTPPAVISANIRRRHLNAEQK